MLMLLLLLLFFVVVIAVVVVLVVVDVGVVIPDSRNLPLKYVQNRN